ncbi:O-antigen ligase family protein [Streptomyces sp. NPDC059740]|uniref:O-antigen ligase family protein n=1 Tax=Streptomyces sp. NPDC059740 TaxID=3346926 RepID=UPI0036618F4D
MTVLDLPVRPGDTPRDSRPPGPPAPRPRGRTPCLPAAAEKLLPALPVCAVLLALCLPVPRGDVASSGHATLPDLVSALAVLWCALSLLRHRSRPLRPVTALLWGAPVLAFAAATLTSGDVPASLPGLVRWMQIFVAVPAAVTLTLRRTDHVRAACWALVTTALVQGAVGVHQNLTATGASYRGQDIRAVGTFGALDVMGMSVVVGCGLVAALALGAGAPSHRRTQRWTAYGCAAALTLPLICSYSRGAWIATAVAGTVVLLMTGPRRALAVLAALAAGAVVLVAGLGVGSATVGERLTSIARIHDAPDQSVVDRYALWDAALGMWSDAPVTGVGLKRFPADRDGHAPLGLSAGSDTAGAGGQFVREPLLSPHNLYLLVLSEQGLCGALAVVGGWAAMLVAGVRRLHDTRLRGRPTDVGAAATGVLVWMLVDFFSSDIGGPSTVLTGVVLGLGAHWAFPARKEGTA